MRKNWQMIGLVRDPRSTENVSSGILDVTGILGGIAPSQNIKHDRST